ncbi:MAG: DUF5343 domain-containing protein [Acidobacteriota bacterium]|nr:DUF5343 domain-containing protein [Acidobacteriota bacterium]
MSRKASNLPPYISYRTFSNFLSELRSRGLPSRIDRSIMAHKSGTIQSQLLLTLNYLGLVRALGQPTDTLKKLVESDDQQQRVVLRTILKTSYTFVFKSDIGLQAATSDQVEELFQKTGASGETIRRCIAFFLAAAKDCGIPISPYVKPHKRRTEARRTKASIRKEEMSSKAEDELSVIGDFRKVNLKSGGSVRLELAVDLFELDDEDREFVFALVDRIKAYEPPV